MILHFKNEYVACLIQLKLDLINILLKVLSLPFSWSAHKKFRPIILIVWVLGKVEKMPRKDEKNEKNIFLFQTNIKV